MLTLWKMHILLYTVCKTVDFEMECMKEQNKLIVRINMIMRCS